METIKVKVKGTAPLIMHKFVENKEKKKKTVYDPAEEAEKVTYRNKKGKLVIPGSHFKASMVKASVDFKMTGKKTYKDYIKSGIFIEEEEILLNKQKYEIDSRPVVINRARIMRYRPLIRDWSCEFAIQITDDMLNKSVIKEILASAGRFKGVGDNRPEYGRFEIVEA